MKPWMKILVWLGLGGGIGFFAGYKSGYVKCANETQEEVDNLRDSLEYMTNVANVLQEENKPTAEQMAAISERMKNIHLIPEEVDKEVKKALDEYGQGGFTRNDTDIQTEVVNHSPSQMIPDVSVVIDPEMLHQMADIGRSVWDRTETDQPATDDEENIPEMPLDEPVMPDIPKLEELDEEGCVELPPEENPVPQLHPQDMVPHPITEDEFNQNAKDYDICLLTYYAEEDVVYDPEYDDAMANPDGLLGIGWFAAFSPTQDTIYIENDTMETLYKVKYNRGSVHDA